MIIIVIILVLLLAFYFYYLAKKHVKVGNMVLVTGGVKTGKSLFSVFLTLSIYKRNLFKYKISKLLRSKSYTPEKPLIYSNIPLKIPYVPLTKELLNRTERFAYGSVIYICESSLVADSMSYKDDELNERMLLLNKLIAHETKGGTIIYDTQSINDNHYAVRRCLSEYIHINKRIRLPFFVVLNYTVMLYSDENVAITGAVPDTKKQGNRIVLIPTKYFKYYDRYCYSIMTDSLKVNNKVVKPFKKMSLKASKIISFKNWRTIK